MVFLCQCTAARYARRGTFTKSFPAALAPLAAGKEPQEDRVLFSIKSGQVHSFGSFCVRSFAAGGYLDTLPQV